MTEFKCDNCNYSTSFKASLKKHLSRKKQCKSHHDEELPREQLLSELYSDNNKKYICKCGKKYSHNSTLSTHKKKCTNYSYIYTCVLNIKNELLKVCQEDVHIIERFFDHMGIDYILQESDKETLKALKNFKGDIDPKVSITPTPKSLEQRLVTNILCRMSSVFDKRCKADIKYVGCSVNILQVMLEKQFVDGMNWNNYGKSIEKSKISAWQMDHIIPCTAFDFNNPIHRYACFHFKNIKPLWTYDNLEKGNKFDIVKRDNYIKQFIELYVV